MENNIEKNTVAVNISMRKCDRIKIKQLALMKNTTVSRMITQWLYSELEANSVKNKK